MVVKNNSANFQSYASLFSLYSMFFTNVCHIMVKLMSINIYHKWHVL